MLVHGTAVAFGKEGVLLRGAPGSGKSSLALRLIDQAGFGLGRELLQAKLVADDQVALDAHDGQVLLSPQVNLAGLIEIRGLGILRCPFMANVPLRLVVDLVPHTAIDRLPPPESLVIEIAGLVFPRLALDPMMPGACARLRAALTVAVARLPVKA